MIILTVGKNPDILKKLQDVIRSIIPEAEFVLCEDTYEALRCIEFHSIDVVFADIDRFLGGGRADLSLVNIMRKRKPELNVVIVSEDGKSAYEALKLHVSGYILKPVTKEDVANELNFLRYPVKDGEGKQDIRVRTFGPFDIFINGKALHFRRERSKEVLAYLVDRRGALVTRKELASVIFEDDEYTRANQAYLTQIIQNLKKTLDEAGIGDIFIAEYNDYAVDTEKLRCDSYDFLSGIPEAVSQFHGEYMSNYSWGEEHIFQFMDEE